MKTQDRIAEIQATIFHLEMEMSFLENRKKIADQYLKNELENDRLEGGSLHDDLNAVLRSGWATYERQHHED
jgi:hypothetical protein